MLLRSVRARAALALLPLLASAACKDQTPTLTGDPFFPGGSRPVTLEVIVPAAQFLDPLGVFQGYESGRTLGQVVVANQYQGVLNANVLQDFNVPDSLTYSQSGTSKTDTAYSIRSARLVIAVDSLASLRGTPTTLQAYRVAQPFDSATATWELAVDTGAVETPWTQPGGTRGALLGSAAYNHPASDTVVIAIDTAVARALRPDSATGLLLATAQAGTRLQLGTPVLRLDLKPSNADRDTTITINVLPSANFFVFNPQPALPATGLAAGGVLAARSLFGIDFDQPLPGCAPPATCPTVRLKDVELNRVSLLLKPLAPPAGFDPIRTVPLTLWTITEPELGSRAPLGHLALDPQVFGNPASQFVVYTPGDTLVELPMTLQVLDAVNRDTLQLNFALLGEAPPVGVNSPRTFGMTRFDALPRLRFVYTLQTRPELP
ncbi:MAG TPA: hypothetical protein VFS20_33645 [Longimicrobium sp.]|nr:hypothetical protein [Longimicrobium sp.]